MEDLKLNCAISTVQKENVWQPYFERDMEDMDFKEKMIQKAEENRKAQVGGANVANLESALGAHDL